MQNLDLLEECRSDVGSSVVPRSQANGATVEVEGGGDSGDDGDDGADADDDDDDNDDEDNGG